MEITSNEATWFLPIFKAGAGILPSPRTFEPYYNATCWDFNDLMRSFREDASRHGLEVWTHCEHFIQKKKWPRTKVETAFWLRERWLMAESYCLGLEQEASKNGRDVTRAKPEDPLAMLHWLVVELWDEAFVDVWLQENARSYVRVDSYAGTDRLVEFEIEMRRFEGKL